MVLYRPQQPNTTHGKLKKPEPFPPARRLITCGLNAETVRFAGYNDSPRAAVLLPTHVILSRLVNVRLPGNPTSGSSL